LARRSKDADQTRRLLALAAIYDGGSRRSADGLIDRKAPGAVPKLNAAQRQALAEKVVCGPTPAVDGVVRWRLKDLAHWIFEEFGISIDETTVGRELKAMGFRKLSARPRHHAQDVEALEDFKKNSRPDWQKSKPPYRREPG
jgi:transposase